jgi:hypothetical protein
VVAIAAKKNSDFISMISGKESADSSRVDGQRRLGIIKYGRFAKFFEVAHIQQALVQDGGFYAGSGFWTLKFQNRTNFSMSLRQIPSSQAVFISRSSHVGHLPSIFHPRRAGKP